MPLTERLTIENVDWDDEAETDAFVDQMFSIGLAQVKVEGAELRQRGLLDLNGNLHLKELPADMKEGADRDFGG